MYTYGKIAIKEYVCIMFGRKEGIRCWRVEFQLFCLFVSGWPGMGGWVQDSSNELEAKKEIN